MSFNINNMFTADVPENNVCEWKIVYKEVLWIQWIYTESHIMDSKIDSYLALAFYIPTFKNDSYV